MFANIKRCPQYQLLKQGYESALRESALYGSAGPASLQQAVCFKDGAKAVSGDASNRLITHGDDCPICQSNLAN
jgi:hypothetical protein